MLLKANLTDDISAQAIARAHEYPADDCTCPEPVPTGDARNASPGREVNWGRPSRVPVKAAKSALTTHNHDLFRGGRSKAYSWYPVPSCPWVFCPHASKACSPPCRPTSHSARECALPTAIRAAELRQAQWVVLACVHFTETRELKTTTWAHTSTHARTHACTHARMHIHLLGLYRVPPPMSLLGSSNWL